MKHLPPSRSFLGKALATTLLIVALVACQAITPVATDAMMTLGSPLGMATLPQTKKLPQDHLASWVTGRNCSIISYEKDGVYCQDPPQRVDDRSVYCTRTIGGVECHQRPDRYYAGDQILGSPPVRYADR